MAMSDCGRCWDTPCSCGWSFKNYTIETLAKYLASITQYREKEEALIILRKALEIAEEEKQVTYKQINKK